MSSSLSLWSLFGYNYSVKKSGVQAGKWRKAQKKKKWKVVLLGKPLPKLEQQQQQQQQNDVPLILSRKKLQQSYETQNYWKAHKTHGDQGNSFIIMWFFL